ncbi:MAG: winged helix-turn-helix transcriptional regulator [Planctomycetaceae bacterium]|nr:winged helix-turn-helix transcriptional regulator [Planctomycetaceae bacterium]
MSIMHPPSNSATRSENQELPAVESLLSVQDCQKAADIFRALGDPVRFQILTLLLQDPMCVSDIATVLDDSLPAVSQRLKLLRKDNIVSVRREGKYSYYSLHDGHVRCLVSNIIEYLSDQAEQNDDP